MFYVYLHLGKKTGGVFYVGKGSARRAFYPYSRGGVWRVISSMEGGFLPSIVEAEMTEEDAFALERWLIEAYTACGKLLANQTRGGEGRQPPRRPDLTSYLSVETASLLASRKQDSRRPVVCIESGVRYPSRRAAAEEHQVTVSRICLAIKNASRVNGATFRDA